MASVSRSCGQRLAAIKRHFINTENEEAFFAWLRGVCQRGDDRMKPGIKALIGEPVEPLREKLRFEETIPF